MHWFADCGMLVAGSSASVFTKNTTSCRFFLANAVCCCCTWHPASSHGGSRDRRKLEELLDLSTFWGMCCRRSWKETNPPRRDFCRPGGSAHATSTSRHRLRQLTDKLKTCRHGEMQQMHRRRCTSPQGSLARAEGVFDATDRLFHVPRRVSQHDPRPLRHPLHHGLLGRNHG